MNIYVFIFSRINLRKKFIYEFLITEKLLISLLQFIKKSTSNWSKNSKAEVLPLRATLYTFRICKLAHVSDRDRLTEATHARTHMHVHRFMFVYKKKPCHHVNNWLWWCDTECCATSTEDDSDSIDSINREGTVSVRWSTTVSRVIELY